MVKLLFNTQKTCYKHCTQNEKYCPVKFFIKLLKTYFKKFAKTCPSKKLTYTLTLLVHIFSTLNYNMKGATIIQAFQEKSLVGIIIGSIGVYSVSSNKKSWCAGVVVQVGARVKTAI